MQEVAAYPHLLAKIQTVIHIWAGIDITMELMAAVFLKADYVVVHEMLAALMSSDGKRAAITAAARETLGDEDFQLYESIMKAIGPSRMRRNEFTHHLWGVSPEVPNALVLLNPKDMARFSADVQQGSVDFDRLRSPDWGGPKQMEVVLYREADLDRSIRDAEAAARLVNTLRISLMPPILPDMPPFQESHARDARMRSETRQRLRDDPLVRPILEKRSRQSTPESSPPSLSPESESP